jgi:hypothetical protein
VTSLDPRHTYPCRIVINFLAESELAAIRLRSSLTPGELITLLLAHSAATAVPLTIGPITYEPGRIVPTEFL